MHELQKSKSCNNFSVPRTKLNWFCMKFFYVQSLQHKLHSLACHVRILCRLYFKHIRQIEINTDRKRFAMQIIGTEVIRSTCGQSAGQMSRTKGLGE